MTKKRNFKAILVSLFMSFLMIFSIFSFAGCGGDDKGKEIDISFVYEKLEEDAGKGISRREKLLTSYETYDYIELEIDTYDPENEILDKNGNIIPNKTEKIYLHQVEGDFLYYYEIITETEHSYSLIKQTGLKQQLFISYYEEDELVKIAGEDVTAENMLQTAFNKFFNDYYTDEMLPGSEELIIAAYKKTFSTDLNRMKSFEIVFNGSYEEKDSINEVSFNYSTNKFHFYKNYTPVEEEMKLLREIEYTYPGNGVTNVEEINMTLFSDHVHTWVDATCTTAKTCSTCNETRGEVSGCNRDENGICTVCYDGAGAVVDGVYYVNFVDAIAAAPSGSTVKLMSNVELQESLVINKDITVDLSGKKIGVKNITVGDGVFHVVAGGKLTINGDGIVDGTSEHPDSDGYHMALWADGGEIVINGGTFTNVAVTGTDTQYDLIYAKNGGIITINGGVFECKTPQWTLNLKDNDNSQIIVKGGTFTEYDPSSSKTENPIGNFLADGYVLVVSTSNGIRYYSVELR